MTTAPDPAHRPVYLNGEFLPADAARIRIDDGAWLHGAGLFETMRAENGRIFRLESHLQRLTNSAERVLRPIEPGQLPGVEVFRELLERNELTAARVRMTVSSGSMRQDGDGADAGQLTVAITVSPLTAYPPAMYHTGVTVVVCGFRQSPADPIAGHKTTCYLPRLLALRSAQQAKCLEALWFTTAHQLAEGSISNVFIVSKGVLKTPPLETPVLPGITRGVILEIARRDRIDTEETALTVDDLLDADEVFLTNTMMQVMPVNCVERHTIGEGGFGKMSRTLRESYRDLVKMECSGE